MPARPSSSMASAVVRVLVHLRITRDLGKPLRAARRVRTESGRGVPVRGLSIKLRQRRNMPLPDDRDGDGSATVGKKSVRRARKFGLRLP